LVIELRKKNSKQEFTIQPFLNYLGIHKHFRIISVQRQFNQNSPVACSIKEIWQRLGNFYGMSALDELVC
jgi:hypothetical protein